MKKVIRKFYHQEIFGDRKFSILYEMYYKVAMCQKYWEIEKFQYFMKCIIKWQCPRNIGRQKNSNTLWNVLQSGNVREILGDRKFSILYEMYYKVAMSQKYWEIENFQYFIKCITKWQCPRNIGRLKFWNTLANVLETVYLQYSIHR